ncbi:MAG: glycosyltransferase, partial [Acidimicrobiales bacterium]
MDPPRPPRLLALNHTALVSGAEAVLLRVLEAASAEGWPVVVACPPGPLATSAVAAGLAHLPLPDLMLPAGPRPLALATLVVRHLRASRLVRRAAAGSDIVVANGIRVLPTLRLARLRVPVVWNAHNLVDLARWRRMVRVCGPAVDLVVSGSRAVVESLPEPRLASRVVRYGTPWPVAPAPAGPRLPLVVGCAAILTSWKGQDVLLDAIAHLGRPEVVVELLGGSFPKDGDYVNA